MAIQVMISSPQNGLAPCRAGMTATKSMWALSARRSIDSTMGKSMSMVLTQSTKCLSLTTTSYVDCIMASRITREMVNCPKKRLSLKSSSATSSLIMIMAQAHSNMMLGLTMCITSLVLMSSLSLQPE